MTDHRIGSPAETYQRMWGSPSSPTPMTTAEIIQAIRASLATVSSDLYPHTSSQLLNDAQHHVGLALSCLDDYLEAQQAVSPAVETETAIAPEMK